MSEAENTHAGDEFHPKHRVAMAAQQLLQEGGCRSFDEFVTEVIKRLTWCSRAYATHVLEKWRSRIEADIIDSAAGNSKHIQILNNIDHESDF
jgi:hypothetical protein